MRCLGLNLHLQPCPQVDFLLAICMLPQALYEQRRDLVDVGLALQHIAERVNGVDNAAVVAMDLLVGLGESIQLLADGSSTPDRIEISLLERRLVSVYLRYCGQLSCRYLVWCNANNWTVLLVKMALHIVHVTDMDPVHVP
jgi:hypothetical protein